MDYYRKLLFLAIAGVILMTSADASANEARSENTMIPMGKFMGWFEDTDHALSPEEALKVEFERFDVNAPNLGMRNSAIWLKIDLAYSPERRVIHIPNTEISSVEAFIFRKGKLIEQAIEGQVIPVEDHTERHILFKIQERSNADQVLLKVVSNRPIILPVYMGTQQAYDSKQTFENLILGGYMGMMLFLLLYNIFIFASTGYRSYLAYVIYIALVTLTQIHFMGLAKLYLWPTNLWLAGSASMILTVITALAANEFFKRFTHAKEQIPRMVTISHVFCTLLVIEMIMSITIFRSLGYELMQMTVGSFAFYQLSMAIVLAFKGNRQSKFFLLAWTVFLIGIVVFIMKDLTILPFNMFTQNTMIFGSAIEGILLSFGLADHIKILRRERQRSQERALQIAKENERIIREQNAMLEEKVQERTADLEKSNNELKSTQSQLVEAEKMASLGQLTAGIAHEINNPLNFISTNIPPLKRDLSEIIEVYRSQAEYLGNQKDPAAAELLKKAKDLDIDYTLEEVDEIVDSIAEGASRTTEIVRGLRDFSRLDEDGMKSADVNQGIKGTIVLLDPELRRNIEIESDLQPTEPFECYPGKLNQVFMNIMNNALQAIHSKFDGQPGGKLIVRTFTNEVSYIVEIIDNGIGMDEATRTKIFEPFFTTKDVGEGVGLGLSITHGIVEHHGGSISVDSELGKGTKFTISIPRIDQRIKKSA